MISRFMPLIAVVASLGIFFGYIGPTWSGPIAETKAAIEVDKQALDAATEYATQQNALLDARLAIATADLERLQIFLPDSVDNVGLILDMNALAARSGVVLSNIDVVMSAPSAASSGQETSSQGDTSPVGSANMSLSVVGSFNSMQTFLRGIEKSARLLDVQDITVKGSDTGVYTYQMSLKLYWLR